ncbi:amino acid/amide ABC transporter substrate-binding protein (HAAT family) [Palleronia aestuarii]|uniref:Amino acid/amide ABC transporter substrate-binding protein (HAAT family) n=1 Tax=Palleronia aestuarii TaxID=568105 RepID=A0A2W7MZC3_9RHOB|nr:ABC transporter substrate-binding protein [Palleronia aestuarii]PZX13031.1 amino acid/amide ABC transporter substrate-binding protein (HAAT family) [Palleronia aestuarii]
MIGTTRRTFVAAVIAAIAAGGTAAAQDDPIRIGAINPYSGQLALYGTEVTRGYELAADQLNANGGLLGSQVEVVRGNAASPQEGIAVVERLAGRDDVDAFIGTYLSAVSGAASEAALNYNKLYWDTNAIAAGLTERGLPNFVRSGPYATTFADASVELVIDALAQELGKDPSELRVWLEHEESVYGTSISERQEAQFEDAGVEVVGVGSHDYRSIDLTDSVLRAKDADPDVFIQTGYVPDGNLLLRTMRDQDFDPNAIVFVGTGDTAETLQAMGEKGVEGLLVVSYPRPGISEEFGPGSGAYLEAYREKYGSDPVAPQGMAAYVGFQIMAEAVEKAGSFDPAEVTAILGEFDEPQGTYATGFGARFDENKQNVLAYPTVIQWQGGEPVTVFPEEAAGGSKMTGFGG